MFGRSPPAAGGADWAQEKPCRRSAGHSFPPVGSARNPPIDWPAIAGDVARALLGEPTSRTRSELRYGRRGSLSVRLDSGTWFDFEAGEGGGVLDLVRRELQCDTAAALAWIGKRDPGPVAP